MPLIKPVFIRKLSNRLKYKTNRKGWKVNIFLIAIIYIGLIFIGSKFFEEKIIPSIIALVESKAHYIATVLIDKEIAEYISSNQITYDQLFHMEKNTEGQISAIISNTSNINMMKSQMSLAMQDRLSALEGSEIKFPLLAFTGNLFIADLGPKIPIRILTTGVISMDFKNNFTSAGVNQTKHEVFIKYNSEISMIFPGRITKAQVESVIPLTEAVIVGVVPNTYINLDGVPINQLINNNQ
jgi:sporulation protein YunB